VQSHLLVRACTRDMLLQVDPISDAQPAREKHTANDVELDTIVTSVTAHAASTGPVPSCTRTRAGLRRAVVAMCNDPTHTLVVEDHFWNWVELAVSWLHASSDQESCAAADAPVRVNHVADGGGSGAAEGRGVVRDGDHDGGGAAAASAVCIGGSAFDGACMDVGGDDTRNFEERDAAECAVALIGRVVDVAGPREYVALPFCLMVFFCPVLRELHITIAGAAIASSASAWSFPDFPDFPRYQNPKFESLLSYELL